MITDEADDEFSENSDETDGEDGEEFDEGDTYTSGSFDSESQPTGEENLLGLRLWDGVMSGEAFELGDSQVDKVVNEYLNLAWKTWGDYFIKNYDPLGSRQTYAAEFGLKTYYVNEAFNLLTEYRQGVSSQDQVARNAQYYLRGYQAGLSGDAGEMLLVLAAPVYEATKLLANGLEGIGYDGLERAIEQGNNHTSPAGSGWLWGWIGLERGLTEKSR